MQHQRLVKAAATARVIDCALSHWPALTTFPSDEAVPIDKTAAESATHPLAVGRKNGLFVASQLAGEHAAVLLSLLESAKLKRHDPQAYFKDAVPKRPGLAPARRLPQRHPRRGSQR